MSEKLRLAVSPHIHSGRSTSRIMLDVIIALLPTAIAGTIIFGLRSLLVISVCVLCCVGFEALYCVLMKKEQTVGDFSAAVTGLLLALNLPSEIPVWQCVVGSAFAIIVVKCLFGGIGCNLVNPAITARVFMIVSFGSMASQTYPTIVDTVSGATPLEAIPKGDIPSLWELFIGLKGGAVGEVCAAAILVGFVYLLVRRVISWHIPVSFIGTVAVLSFIMEGFDITATVALLLSGGLLLGAIFMATDYVTSPATASGKLIFGLGAGVITFLIRYFGVYPEGVSFAILFMNILNPYIEKLTAHKVMGGKRA